MKPDQNRKHMTAKPSQNSRRNLSGINASFHTVFEQNRQKSQKFRRQIVEKNSGGRGSTTNTNSHLNPQNMKVVRNNTHIKQGLCMWFSLDWLMVFLLVCFGLYVVFD
jgi:hypothetical protein